MKLGIQIYKGSRCAVIQKIQGKSLRVCFCHHYNANFRPVIRRQFWPLLKRKTWIGVPGKKIRIFAQGFYKFPKQLKWVFSSGVFVTRATADPLKTPADPWGSADHRFKTPELSKQVSTSAPAGLTESAKRQWLPYTNAYDYRWKQWLHQAWAGRGLASENTA